ncbi:MAG: hypothetical protein FJ276_05790 [Planctomycetes bacterium]|nr:hypothetical protein [Planctomycetota bacterium]
MHASECPDRDQIEQHLLGELADSDTRRIGLHLEHCAACRKLAADLESVGAQLLEVLQAPLSQPFLEEPACREMLRGELSADAVVPLPGSELGGRYRLERILGRGGFGTVYLAHDSQLDRAVAVKVPRPERIVTPDEVAQFLTEARIVANLDHPGIAPVHDIGRTEDGYCYVVSKLVDGCNLREYCRRCWPSCCEAAGLVAQVAEALHHAHVRGIVHRDVKPCNILIDDSGKPFLTDFGLAIREQELGRGPTSAGTPEYMSPEQARGEGHRVDGRADIFSLGIVLYELLTGKCPFRGETRVELRQQITTVEPRPPRQINDSLPGELERICLKALAKRVSDRYTTALDLAEDLRRCIADMARSRDAAPDVRSSLPNRTTATAASDAAPPATGRASVTPSDHEWVVVPKGLRAFGAEDRDFFLDLLPGPRDRDGLPELVRFWKARLEATEPGATFAVGLIYGESGCGKSSLVAAGLLPRLAEHVLPILVTATTTATETQLLRALQTRCPALAELDSLEDAVATIRRARGAPGGRKVLIVLDQFEQWLHGKAGEDNPELVRALRHCDGAHVQCVVIARDDFWMAATRFFNQLEIPLLQGQNVGAVELFDRRHARHVLAAFGRAYGNLPRAGSNLSQKQRLFLTQAVAALAEDGKVACVRLAVFAEMLKSRDWTPETLKELGGVAGVGLKFFEETFCSHGANPAHRLHERAARSVLEALLPESTANIKGRMRTADDLREASGYATRPRGDFDNLLHILDHELRLITPVDLQSLTRGDHDVAATGRTCYQLTHDYLVPSLREWLTSKRRETRRGRAELRLAERADLWNVKREGRHLPSAWEYLAIRTLTARGRWSQAERAMMARARRHHLWRASLSAAAFVIIIWTGWEYLASTRAAALVRSLATAETGDVPQIIDELANLRRWADPRLRDVLRTAPADGKQRLHASLALLPVDKGQTEFLLAYLLEAAPDEILVVRDQLRVSADRIKERLWMILTEEIAPDTGPRRLRAACALAAYDADDDRWNRVRDDVVAQLVQVQPVFLAYWRAGFVPVGEELAGPLCRACRDRMLSDVGRIVARDLLAEYAADQPAVLVEAIQHADESQFPLFFERLERHADEAARELGAAIRDEPRIDWKDPPLDDSWKASSTDVARQLEAADGLLAERFAFCQTLRLDEFPSLADRLRKLGYRPTRARPYAVGDVPHVAAVWKRDGRNWQWRIGTVEEITALDEQLRGQGYQPEDVCGVVPSAGDAASAPRLAGLWVACAEDLPPTRMLVTTDDSSQQETVAALESKGFKQRVNYGVVPLERGKKMTCVLLTNGSAPHKLYSESGSGYSGDLHIGLLQVDVHVGPPIAAPGAPELSGDTNAEPSPHAQTDVDPHYTAAWHLSAAFESTGVHGAGPAEQRDRCRKLIDAGYRPVCLSAFERASGRIERASVWHRPLIPEAQKDELAKRKANAAVALMRLDRRDDVWPMLRHGEDPRTRSYLIHRLARLGADPRPIIDRLKQESDDSVRRALLLCLGEYGPDQLPAALRETMLPALLGCYRDDPDPGLHAAAEWLLRTWGQTKALAEINRAMREQRQQAANREPSDGRRWYVTSQEHTMIVIQGGPFLMGSSSSDPDRKPEETLHRKRIDRRYALSSAPITREQYRAYQEQSEDDEIDVANNPQLSALVRTDDSPIMALSWYEAAAYCNWLSEKEGIPEDQWCYLRNGEGKYKSGMRVRENAAALSGYRLPTEAEWEYACRARAITRRHFGHGDDLLSYYAWYADNSNDRAWPVATKKPNDFGLFDMHGHVFNWCQTKFDPQHRSEVDDVLGEVVLDTDNRVLCSMSSMGAAKFARAANRSLTLPITRLVGLGFRVARTCP